MPAIVEAMLGAAPSRRRSRSADEALREQVAEALDERRRRRSSCAASPVEGALRAVHARRCAPGEVVGLAGVAGAGHHAVLELVGGLRRARRRVGRRCRAAGRCRAGCARAIRAGVALVSGDRRRLGLMLDKPIWENIAPDPRRSGWRPTGRIVRAGASAPRGRAIRSRGCRCARARSTSPRARLSGGNQQKVVFAKWLDAQPSVVLLDDPTRGVDVGAKAEMHALIRSTADAGAPVLICSTDIDELASLCDRVVVLHQGRASAELVGRRARRRTRCSRR